MADLVPIDTSSLPAKRTAMATGGATSGFWAGLGSLTGTVFGGLTAQQEAKAERAYYEAQLADKAAMAAGNTPPEATAASTQQTVLLIGAISIAALGFVLIARRLL